MAIGIIGAMKEEIANVREYMSDVVEVLIGEGKHRKTFYKGKINEQDVVLVLCGVGKVAAAATTSFLLCNNKGFNVDSVIFTGVAGAVDASLTIGDVVVADALYHHDMDARVIGFKKHEIPFTDTTFYHSHKDLIKIASNAIDHLFTPDSPDLKVRELISALHRFGNQQPKCCVGRIASGDQFINKKEQYEDFESGTMAVEMEGVAVAQVSEYFKTPCVVIRIISDLANDDSHIDFQEFIKTVASPFSSLLINYYLKHV